MQKVIRPQQGFQMNFLSSSADIVIGGSSAGVGKTFSLLLEPLRHTEVKGFGAVCFRRTSPQIKAEGALWDTSMEIYNSFGGKPKESVLEWQLNECSLKFSHLEHEKNIYDWQGSQIPLIMFDELTHFTKKMFFYMLSRNRSVCGVKPYLRATCNPDPDSWLAEFLEWWIDQETGFPIKEREGVIRYLVLDGDSYIWGDTQEEVIKNAWHILEKYVEASGIDPKELIKSVTFVAGSIYDNKALLDVDPSYLGNLLAQDDATKSALLDGNWKVVLSKYDLFEYQSFSSSFTNTFVTQSGDKYITADIALKGSDKFVVWVWHGYTIIDVLIMDKSNGKEVVDSIEGMAKKHRIPNHNIIFDNDGVGSFLDGFIVGAKEFVNNSRALNGEKYKNLKTQCYYKMADKFNTNEVYILESVLNKMYDDKMTIRQRLLHERKAIKRAKIDMEDNLQINSKKEQKAIINGQSPDLFDAIAFRALPDLEPTLEYRRFRR